MGLLGAGAKEAALLAAPAGGVGAAGAARARVVLARTGAGSGALRRRLNRRIATVQA